MRLAFFTLSPHFFYLVFKSSIVALLSSNFLHSFVEANLTCSVYLAESSIVDGGYGVFAGKDFQTGEIVGEGGLGIQVIDPDEESFQNELISEYGWNPTTVGGDGEANSVFTTLPGIAMLVNFHPHMSNVIASGLTEESILDRQKDPGAGGVTSYHNFTFLAGKTIEAGQELFAEISNEWYRDRENDSDDDVIPLSSDYMIADKLMKDLNSYKNDHPNLSEAAFLDILLRIKKEMIHRNEAFELLIPETIEQVLKGAEIGTARTRLNERSIKWIEENGKCLDNIKAGISTVNESAGRGAFATRFIPKGSLIAPCPLVHIIDKESLLSTTNSTHDGINKYQLLLNYCFGHRESSLLLCPTTSVTLINHNNDKSKVNAIYEWTPTKEKGKPNYRMRPIEDLEPKSASLSEYNSKLSFDFVATRDINEGEEIFIDYGKEWVDAWNNHIERWEKEGTTESHISASVMNTNKAEIKLSSETDGKHVHYSYLCELEPFARDEDPNFEADTPEEDYHANPSLNRDNWDNHTSMMYLKNQFIWWWPCVVESKNQRNDLFTVRVLQRSAEDHNNRPTIRLLKNFPRDSIKFIDKPYHSDQHLSNAFRHYIPISDEIFPLHWRNDYVTGESVRFGEKDLGKHFDAKVKEDYLQSLKDAKCGIYLATSTIPNSGKGTFVGVEIPSKGIDVGPRIPILPITDFKAATWDAYDYTWAPGAYLSEFEANSVQVLTPNEGCLSNFHPGLVNMAMNDVTYKPVLDRRIDPGAGAFSDYRDYSFKSEYRLEAGREIFISYGENWFSHRSQFTTVPLSQNYEDANGVVASLIGMSAGTNPTLNEHEVKDFLGIVKKDIVLDERTQNLFTALETLDDVRKVTAANGTAESTSEIRSLEWLEENGECLDHIYVKDSTIPQAGKGAFARRPIARGTTIIPAPMLNSWGRDIFNITSEEIKHDVNTKQLIYNYLWTHPESSLLLFPVNTAIAINHASNRRFSRTRPNAELRFSRTDKKSMYYQQSHLEELKKEHYVTVVLDFVATRDIMPDEEILIDYGEEWENAWLSHVKNYESPCSMKGKSCLNSSRAVDLMNEDKFNTQFHDWGDTYFTVCSSTSKPSDTKSIITLIPTDTKESDNGDFKGDSENAETYSYKYSFHDIYYDHPGFELAGATIDSWYPCMILDKNDQQRTFNVVYFTYEEPLEYPKGGVLRKAKSLGQDDIRFINRPYFSDMHWNGAFRHEMKIPDAIFPSLWKDLTSEE